VVEIVALTLKQRGPMTRHELVERSGYCLRSVDQAIARLSADGRVAPVVPVAVPLSLFGRRDDWS
jgi:hypothetical protein